MPPAPPVSGPDRDASSSWRHSSSSAPSRHVQRGELREAEHLCRTVLASKDRIISTRCTWLAIIDGQSGNAQQAADLLSRAAWRSIRASADAHFNRGVALGELKRHEEAVASYDRAIALKADYADAHYNRGIALGELDRHAEALASYARAIELRRDFAEAHNNHGIRARPPADVPDEALASYERAIALRPSTRAPATISRMRRPISSATRDALASFDRAIALKPDYAEACNNRGIVLTDVGRGTPRRWRASSALSLKARLCGGPLQSRQCAARAAPSRGGGGRAIDRAIALRPITRRRTGTWRIAICCSATSRSAGRSTNGAGKLDLERREA